MELDYPDAATAPAGLLSRRHGNSAPKASSLHGRAPSGVLSIPPGPSKPMLGVA